MVVSKEGVFVNSKQIVVFKDGKILDSDVGPKIQDSVVPLFNELDKYAKQSQEIAKLTRNTNLKALLLFRRTQVFPMRFFENYVYLFYGWLCGNENGNDIDGVMKKGLIMRDVVVAKTF